MFYKRYLVFGFDGYYPAGGFNDYRASFDTMDEAEEYWITPLNGPFGDVAPDHTWDWGEIIDLETGERTALDGGKRWE